MGFEDWHLLPAGKSVLRRDGDEEEECWIKTGAEFVEQKVHHATGMSPPHKIGKNHYSDVMAIVGSVLLHLEKVAVPMRFVLNDHHVGISTEAIPDACATLAEILPGYVVSVQTYVNERRDLDAVLTAILVDEPICTTFVHTLK